MNGFLYSLPELFFGNYNDPHPYAYLYGIPTVTLKLVKAGNSKLIEKEENIFKVFESSYKSLAL